MESPASGITFSRWLQSSSLARTAASSTDPRRMGDHVTHSSVQSAWASQTLFCAKSSQRGMPFSSLMLSVFRHRDKVFMLQALFLSKIWLRWTKAVGAPFKTCFCGPFQLLWHPHIQSGPIHPSPGWISPFPIRIFRWLLAEMCGASWALRVCYSTDWTSNTSYLPTTLMTSGNGALSKPRSPQTRTSLKNHWKQLLAQSIKEA